jgi:SAM-dependent methyltransferase
LTRLTSTEQEVSMPAIEAVDAHYAPADLERAVVAGLTMTGASFENLRPEALSPVDQFHLGGRDATHELLGLAGLGHGLEVVDVGGGLGGAARTLAVETSATVTVLDATEEFCRAGTTLTGLVGLEEAVTFVRGDATAMPFPDASFDAAWLQHVSMNVEAKERLFAEIHRVLRPAGRLLLHEILAGPTQPIHYPVPWAPDASLSFLRGEREMRELLRTARFAEIAWQDSTPAAHYWWRDRLQVLTENRPPPLGIHLLLGPDAPAIRAAMLRNFEERRIDVAYGVLERA